MLKNVDKILKTLAKQQGVSMLGSFRKYPAWKILISTILSARANDAATIPATKNLFKKYKSLKALANADPNVVKKIIKKTVYYNQKTKYIINTAKKILKDYGGKVPKDLDELMKLPGVGVKVACCVLVYAFNIPEIPIDTHVAVVANRLGWTKETDPIKIWKDLKKKIPKKYWLIVNELFVVHGQTICFKRKPKCPACPVRKLCIYPYKTKSL